MTMERIPAVYLYRLRMIAELPRFYKLSVANNWLAKRGLIERTGRHDEAGARAEYAITPAGRAALARSTGEPEA